MAILNGNSFKLGYMAEILFISHRVPYPPNKGEKIRAFQLIQALKNMNHRVTCAFPIENQEDIQSADELSQHCDYVLYPKQIKSFFDKHLSALKGILTHNSLTKAIGFNPKLYETLHNNKMYYDIVIFYSSVSYFYKNAVDYKFSICDFVDMDSFKWLEYAQQASFPMSWIYRREAKLLKEIEKNIALDVDHSLFVTHNEKQLFIDENKPIIINKPISAIECSVDTIRFNSEIDYINPFLLEHQQDINFVMTGAMDYKPNYDGALFFIHQILPYVQTKTDKKINFYCVGRNPVDSLKELHNPLKNVVITSNVPDVRPYMAHSYACVAPLFIGRGIQNKVLEAMAMGKTCFVSNNAFEGIDAQDNKHLILCKTLEEWRNNLIHALNNQIDLEKIGQQARNHVSVRYHQERISEKFKHIINQFITL
jgi:sugar transferase (PEP-CTERM/EpsH1 system associated)